MPNQSPLCEPLEAAEGVDVEPRLLHDVAVGDAVDGLVADGAAGRHLAPRADGFEITPLESPANRGTAIMQGAILRPSVSILSVVSAVLWSH